ncbi:PQQ-dependent sugar dehydrogenase [Streptomyces cellulosae]|uniref:PQQ-dependent sugar dehydrogenase n=1 Tax=Streptomyces cellulosae TaxID=1968 RepID=A0ABW7YA51_STRCE
MTTGPDKHEPNHCPRTSVLRPQTVDTRVPARGGDATLVGVVPDVDVSSEAGLLGIVESSTFNDDRTVFASGPGAEENRIVALTIADDYASLAVGRVRLDGIRTADRHHGGPLVIGPDGMLWIGTGDDFEPENGLFPIQGVDDLRTRMT